MSLIRMAHTPLPWVCLGTPKPAALTWGFPCAALKAIERSCRLASQQKANLHKQAPAECSYKDARSFNETMLSYLHRNANRVRLIFGVVPLCRTTNSGSILVKFVCGANCHLSMRPVRDSLWAGGDGFVVAYLGPAVVQCLKPEPNSSAVLTSTGAIRSLYFSFATCKLF